MRTFERYFLTKFEVAPPSHTKFTGTYWPNLVLISNIIGYQSRVRKIHDCCEIFFPSTLWLIEPYFHNHFAAIPIKRIFFALPLRRSFLYNRHDIRISDQQHICVCDRWQILNTYQKRCIDILWGKKTMLWIYEPSFNLACKSDCGWTTHVSLRYIHMKNYMIFITCMFEDLYSRILCVHICGVS